VGGVGVGVAVGVDWTGKAVVAVVAFVGVVGVVGVEGVVGVAVGAVATGNGTVGGVAWADVAAVVEEDEDEDAIVNGRTRTV
jgi:hypothetical protein